MDPKSQELIALEITDDKVADSLVLPKLIDGVPRSVKKVFADGAYDKARCRKYLMERGIKGCIAAVALTI